MFKKEKYLLVMTLLVIFMLIIIANAQEVLVADNFRFPLEGGIGHLYCKTSVNGIISGMDTILGRMWGEKMLI